MSGNKIRVAIIECNKEVCKNICDYLENNPLFYVVGVADDGEKGLKLVLNNSVDVLLLDAVLPVKDGMHVLENIKAKKIANLPLIVMITAFSNEEFIRRAISLGVNYFMSKPFNTQLLLKRVVDLYQIRLKEQRYINKYYISTEIMEKEKIDTYITNVLEMSGLSSEYKGYEYLKAALSIAIKDCEVLTGITKILYPDVAKIYDTTPSNIEKSIRLAIYISWETGDNDVFFKHLGFSLEENLKPTNSRFIKKLVQDYKNLKESHKIM